MDYLNDINNYSIIITNSVLKKKVLMYISENKILLHTKIFTKQEFIKKYLFDYSEGAILYLMDHYHYSAQMALTLLNNMYYLSGNNYQDKKINDLNSLKEELINKNLLHSDLLFKERALNKSILVIDVLRDKLLDSTLNILSNNTEVKYINYHGERKISVFEFDQVEEEVTSVALEIRKLIDDGVPISDINIYNYGEEYNFTIQHIFNMFSLPLENKCTLYEIPIANYFLRILKDSYNLGESLNQVVNKYSLQDEYNLRVYNQMISIINKSLEGSNESIYQYLKYLFKNTSISSMEDGIKLVNMENADTSKYLFIMGFNQGNILKTKRDEDYFKDTQKKLLNTDTSSEYNKSYQEYFKNKLFSFNNLWISYKLKTPYQIYQKSYFLDDINAQIIIKEKENNYSYSETYNILEMGKMIDKYHKYQEQDDSLSILYSNYEYLLFPKYNNQFSGINKEKLVQYLNHNLNLSYSKIDIYNKCSFRYYIEFILSLGEIKNEFDITIGNFFHDALSKCYDEKFNFDTYCQEYWKGKDLNKKEQILINKLTKELKKVIENLISQQEYTNYHNYLFEQKISVPISNDPKIQFMGIVDKIMYNKDNNSIALVDYKTGNVKLDLNYCLHGFNMQLPIYLYLLKNSKIFSNMEFTGFYYQKILNSPSSAKGKTREIDSEEKENLKLKGYTIDNLDKIKDFDKTYENSRLIKSMKCTKEGFSRFTKLINDLEIDNLILLAEQNIKKCSNDIINASFFINPKNIDNELIGCAFCKYHDICYKTYSDLVMIKTEIEGDDNEVDE